MKELGTYAEMAGYAHSILMKDGLSIPAKQARIFIQTVEFLEALKNGSLEIDGNKVDPGVQADIHPRVLSSRL